ncbi:MAG TPA: pilus assembly PilX N-terminal domain-containing protein [Candidatus Gastranaerophilales bacterium]|nr:pilus assembly PilX N-terminal domain-containing protein [Candidatus Gastranaerophilales bacterium]
MKKFGMKKIRLNAYRKGAALVVSLFMSILASMIVILMMEMSQTNTNQITNNRSGLVAYYAAESGLEEVKNFFNRNISMMGQDLNALDLPDSNSHSILANNAEYWVSSLTYENSNQIAIVEIIGQFGDGFRKIRAKLATENPSVFDDYGLLTNGVLTINGSKTLSMSVHANSGLNFNGTDVINNNAVATQSSDPTADAPHAILNPIGGYVPDVYVPIAPVDDLRVESKSNGILLDITQGDLNAQINNAPAGSNIYITAGTKINKNTITLSGDMQGKTIFLDGSVTVDINGANPLSNATIVTSGDMVVNGSVDIVSSHADEIDVVFACGGDVELNGSRDFTSLFWANGRFTQNGASLSGRVIASEAIFLNGSFILTNSDNLTDKNIFDKVIATSSWQLVSMD